MLTVKKEVPDPSYAPGEELVNESEKDNMVTCMESGDSVLDTELRLSEKETMNVSLPDTELGGNVSGTDSDKRKDRNTVLTIGQEDQNVSLKLPVPPMLPPTPTLLTLPRQCSADLKLEIK